MKYSIRNGSVTLSGNTILEEVDFEVNSREHIAIVGPNGAGKTTLLNAIINPELFDEGIGDEKFNITKIGEFNIGFLKQIEFKDDRELLIDIVREPFKELINTECFKAGKKDLSLSFVEKIKIFKVIRHHTECFGIGYELHIRIFFCEKSDIG